MVATLLGIERNEEEGRSTRARIQWLGGMKRLKEQRARIHWRLCRNHWLVWQ